MASKPNVLILGGLNTCARPLVQLIVQEGLAENVRVVDKFSVTPPTTYIGPEFPKLLKGNNVEYQQANLTVPATITKVFDPPAGQAPYEYVFDFTGEIRYDRPEVFQIEHTAKLSYAIALEASKRSTVKAYIRLMHPWYDTSLEKKAHTEGEEIKPAGGRGTWWHEGLRMAAALPGLNLVILRAASVYGPYCIFGDITTRIAIGLVYKSLDEEMKYMWTAGIRNNTVHQDDVAGASWAAAKWIAGIGRAEADKAAGEEIWSTVSSAKAKELGLVDGFPDPKAKVVAPLFNVVDSSDTTQQHMGSTIAKVFGIKFGFHGFIANTLASTTESKFSDIVEDVNEKHMSAWTTIITTSTPPVPNTPLTAYTDAQALSKFSIAYAPGKLEKVTGYKMRRPTFDEGSVREVIEGFRKEGTWPETSYYK